MVQIDSARNLLAFVFLLSTSCRLFASDIAEDPPIDGELLSLVTSPLSKAIQDIHSRSLHEEDICENYEILANTLEGVEDHCNCIDGVMICRYDSVQHEEFLVSRLDLELSLSFDGPEKLAINSCAQIPGYKATCFHIGMGNEEQLVDCSQATYGGEECVCEICADKRNVILNCGQYDPHAVSNGCIHLDIMNLTSIVPYFGLHPNWNTSTDSFSDLSTVIVESKVDPASHTCNNFQFLEYFHPRAQEDCHCEGSNVACNFHTTCTKGVCAESVDLSIDLSEGISVSSCSMYTESTNFDEMCFEMNIPTDRSLASCKGTYGGKECSCNVCNNGTGVDLDCSEYGPNVPLIGCQPVAVASMSSYQLGQCGELGYIIDRIDNGEQRCECSGGTKAVCTYGGECDENTCSFPAEVTLDLQEELSMKSCTNYTSEFEETCVEFTIDSERLLDKCLEATYGGKNCVCSVCDDKSSVYVNCGDHNRRAVTDGCQDIHLMQLALLELSPFQPRFDVYAANVTGIASNGNNHENNPKPQKVEKSAATLHQPLLGLLVSIFLMGISSLI